MSNKLDFIDEEQNYLLNSLLTLTKRTLPYGSVLSTIHYPFYHRRKMMERSVPA